MSEIAPDPAPTTHIKGRILRAQGLTFSAWEAGTGPLALCVHGFPDTARSFRHQLPALAAKGRWAVAPTLRGYESSSQSSSYHLVDLVDDVLGWLDHLEVEQAHFIGHDWGAVLGQLACARAPERFRSLTLLAIPPLGPSLLGQLLRPRQLRKSWYIAFILLPRVADRAMRRGLVRRLWADWSPGWSPSASELDAIESTLAEPGVTRAALAYYRAFATPNRKSRQAFRLLSAPLVVPTLAITGARDGCLDTHVFDGVHPREGLRVERIADAGHFVHQEQPDAVNRLLLEWMSAHD